ncbi:MAG: ABC transporter ATP-binding protein [Verrucomicrobiales bacterium]|nr:ABC transporter ATP-binding protein [Verrucomicrobiales bacterium]
MKSPARLSETVRVLAAVMRRFGPQLRGQRWVMLGAFGALVAEIGFRLLEPWLLKIVFDALLVSGPNRVPWMEGMLASFGRNGVLVGTCLLVVILAGLRAGASYMATIGFAQAGSRMMSEVRAVLFRHLQCLSLAFHQRSRGGDLVLRVINDVSQLQDVLVTAVVPLVTRVAMWVGMVGLMFAMNPRLAILAVAVLPVFWLRGLKLSRGIHEVARRQRHREGEMAATAAESLGSMSAVKALSLEERFAQTFGKRNARALREDVQGKRLSAKLERSVDVFIAAATALVLWQGTRMVWSSELTPGDLLVFLAYLKTAFRPLQDSAKYSGRLAKAAAAGERVLAVLEERATVADRPDARPAPAFRGDVRFEAVTYRHEGLDGKPRRGIEGVSFEARPGQIVALVGPSGSGKSTVLSLVSRLFDPEEGRVLVDGHDLRDLTVASVRSQVAVVQQDTGLFAGTVADNIRAGRDGASDADVEAAAVLAQADEFIARLPDGYRTVLGERGVTLSQGQRQRLAVARAALRRSPILLLDEPTAGLDQAGAEAVFQGIRQLAVHSTVILATHFPREAALADQVIHLDHGRVHSVAAAAAGVADEMALEASHETRDTSHVVSR